MYAAVIGWPASIAWASRPLRKGSTVSPRLLVPSGKKTRGMPASEAALHSLPGALGGAAASAMHIQRACHGAHPAQQGPAADLRFADEDAAVQRREGDDVQIAEVVGDDDAALGERPLPAHRDAHPADGPHAELVQPFGPLLARGWALRDELQRGVGEDRRQLQASAHRPSKVHQAQLFQNRPFIRSPCAQFILSACPTPFRLRTTTGSIAAACCRFWRCCAWERRRAAWHGALPPER